MDDLKRIGISLQNPELVEMYYQSLKGVFLQEPIQSNTQGLFLDLNSLPTAPLDLKTAVIKWIINVNMPRLISNREPIVTLDLVLKCPVWKIIKPPLKKIDMTKDKMFNKPKVKTTFQKKLPGMINK